MKTTLLLLTAAITALHTGCVADARNAQNKENIKTREESAIAEEKREIPEGYATYTTENEDYRITFYTAPGAVVPKQMQYDEKSGRYVSFIELPNDGNDMFTEITLYVQDANPEDAVFQYEWAADLMEEANNQTNPSNGYENTSGGRRFDVTEVEDISVDGWTGYEGEFFSMAGGEGYEACFTAVRKDGLTVTIYNQSFFELTEIRLVGIEKK